MPERDLPTLLAVASVGPGLAAAGLVAWGRRRRAEGPADVLVVPGARVLPDGSPSGALRRRVATAARLHALGRAPTLAISGAGGEAEAGAALARAAGVPPAALLLERDATTTAENALRLAGLLGADAHVLVVTCDAHAARCALLFGRRFRRVDVHGVHGGSASLRLGVRELGSWARLLARDLGAPATPDSDGPSRH